MTSLELQKTFRPKSGKNKHWFYKSIADFTPKEKKECDAYWAVFLKEWKLIFKTKKS